MDNYGNNFNISGIILIQKCHLSKWKKILTKKCYDHLENYCCETNKVAVSWKEVKHGCDLTDFVVSLVNY